MSPDLLDFGVTSVGSSSHTWSLTNAMRYLILKVQVHHPFPMGLKGILGNVGNSKAGHQVITVGMHCRSQTI